MIKIFTTSQQKIGQRGEQIALKYLISKDFEIVQRNYSTKDGEIDIIAIKDNVFYFIEIKTTLLRNSNVFDKNRYKPEYNVSREKLLKIKRCAETYVFEYNVSCETCFGVLLIEIDDKNNRSYIRFMGNIIIENQASENEY